MISKEELREPHKKHALETFRADVLRGRLETAVRAHDAALRRELQRAGERMRQLAAGMARAGSLLHRIGNEDACEEESECAA